MYCTCVLLSMFSSPEGERKELRAAMAMAQVLCCLVLFCIYGWLWVIMYFFFRRLLEDE